MTPASASAPCLPSSLSNNPTCWYGLPGRVNLIGEHTDYNDGFVLPAPSTTRPAVAIGLRGDNLVAVIAADYDNQRDQFSPRPAHRAPPQPALERLHPRRGETPAGTGHALRGLNLVVSGNVPPGDRALLLRFPGGGHRAGLQGGVGAGRTSARRSPSTASRRRTSSSAATAASWIR